MDRNIHLQGVPRIHAPPAYAVAACKPRITDRRRRERSGAEVWITPGARPGCGAVAPGIAAADLQRASRANLSQPRWRPHWPAIQRSSWPVK